MAIKPKPTQVIERPFISCAYTSCLEGAICRVWTSTGWANVCKTHHKVIPTAPRRTENLTCEEIRTKYAASTAFTKRLPQQIGQIIPERVPGEDDGMPASLPADPFEIELQA